MLSTRRLSFYGRYSFRRQLAAEVLVSIGSQTGLLGLVILARIFHPSDAAITTMFAANHTTFLVAPWITERMQRHGARAIFTVMLLSAPALLLLAPLLEGFWGLGLLLVATNLVLVSSFVPLRNRIMRSNYGDQERGHCYATFTMFSQGIYFGLILSAALALERDADHVYWMLPVVGLLVGAGLWMFRALRIRHEGRQLAEARRGSRKSFLGIYKDMVRLLVTERRFLMYELGFMLYGAGFMLTVPRELDAVANVLTIDYTLIACGIYGVSPVARVLCVRWFGRLLDRHGPYHLAAAGYLVLAAYPLCLLGAVALESIPFWFAARIAFGVAMGGVDIAWTIGPVSFGDRARASTFSAVHIFLVGLRASIGPFIGLGIARVAGVQVFAIGALALVVAAVYMRWRGRIDAVATPAVVES